MLVFLHQLLDDLFVLEHTKSHELGQIVTDGLLEDSGLRTCLLSYRPNIVKYQMSET